MQENKERLSINRKLNIIFAVLVIVLFVAALFNSDAFSRSYLPEMTEFDTGWYDENGKGYLLSEITTRAFEGKTLTLTKLLPYYLFDGECICFETRNVNIR